MSQSQRTLLQKSLITAVSLLFAIAVTSNWPGWTDDLFTGIALAAPDEEEEEDDEDEEAEGEPDTRTFTTDFRLQDRVFTSKGESRFFVLQPGYQLVFEGEEDGEFIRFVITVTDETETIDVPGIGTVETRVVQEDEWADGEPLEFSRAYFAMCAKTGDVFDFGDDVDIFNDDGTVDHEGSWRAGQPDDNGVAMPGLFVPGRFLYGARYYQQLADGLSMERAENMEMGLTIRTKAGVFKDCILVHENNAIEPGISEKFHAPGVGLVKEDELELVQYGFNIVKETAAKSNDSSAGAPCSE